MIQLQPTNLRITSIQQNGIPPTKYFRLFFISKWIYILSIHLDLTILCSIYSTEYLIKTKIHMPKPRLKYNYRYIQVCILDKTLTHFFSKSYFCNLNTFCFKSCSSKIHSKSIIIMHRIYTVISNLVEIKLAFCCWLALGPFLAMSICKNISG